MGEETEEEQKRKSQGKTSGKTRGKSRELSWRTNAYHHVTYCFQIITCINTVLCIVLCIPMFLFFESTAFHAHARDAFPVTAGMVSRLLSSARPVGRPARKEQRKAVPKQVRVAAMSMRVARGREGVEGGGGSSGCAARLAPVVAATTVPRRSLVAASRLASPALLTLAPLLPCCVVFLQIV